MMLSKRSGSAIALFPCDELLAHRLCDYIWGSLKPSTVDCIVLSKQEAVQNLVKNYPFRETIVLDEPFYGRVSKPETKQALKRLERPFDGMVIFPHNDFRGNGFLLGACLAPIVRSVNVTHSGKERVIFDCPGRGSKTKTTFPQFTRPQWPADVVTDIRKRLIEMESAFDHLVDSSNGERPTLGILHGFPYDLEVLVRYQSVASWCDGCEVLDVGSGAGYGSYVIAKQAKSIVGLDTDAQAVQFSQEAWGALCNNLSFRALTSSKLTLEKDLVDRVICFEVLEHVTQPEELVREFWNVLKPGGLLVASTPNPHLFPYRVNAQESVVESIDDYRKQGVWAWHVSGLPPEDSVRMALDVGFCSAYLVYPTYVAGFEYLSRILNASSSDVAISVLNEATHWKLDDFALTSEFSPCFSGYSYVLVAQKD